MLTEYAFEIWANDQQPDVSISFESGQGTAVVHLLGRGTLAEFDPPTIADVSAFAAELLGSVSNAAANTTSGADGKIHRVLPPVHPVFPQLSVAAINSVRGATEAGKTQVQVDDLDGLVPLSTAGAIDLYASYLFDVTLVKRTYFLLEDDAIDTEEGSIYNMPDGTSTPYTHAQEWKRYTELITTPRGDAAHASAGSMILRTGSGTGVNGGVFTGEVAQFLQNQEVKVRWFMVPYRYFFPVTIGATTYRPYLTRFYGCVNQYEWNGFPAGSLLYLGATPQPYIPPVPDTIGFGGDNTSISRELLCNVEMTFMYTTREGTDVPTPASMARANWIPAGHNLMPNWSDRKFYYVSTKPFPANPLNEAPCFLSFPFELLFTDPLANVGI